MTYSKTTWINNETKLNADNMNKIENGIEANSNNMPTDINVDDNGYLVLEHDGKEITGQKKLFKCGKYDEDTNTLEIGGNLYVDGTGKVNKLVVYDTDDVDNGIIFHNGNRALIHIGSEANDIYFETLDEDGNLAEDYCILPIILGRGPQIVLTNNNTKTLFGNKSIYGGGNIDLYRHQIEAQDADGVLVYFAIISSNNLKIDSLQDLTTVTKASAGYQENCLVELNSGEFVIGVLGYSSSNAWKVRYFSDEVSNITLTKIKDTVTPI